MQILQILADKVNHSSHYGVHRSIMLEKLNLSEKDMDFNMAFLSYKGFVKLVEAPNCSWLWSKITTYGLNYIKRTNIELVKSQHIADVFQTAHELIREQIHMPSIIRSQIYGVLDLLEKELTKKEPDAGSIQEKCKWLGKNAEWAKSVLCGTVIDVINENLF